MKDRLYLLKPNFLDHGKTYFCPGCAQVEGMLSFYPALRKQIEVFYIDFPRPRPGLVAEIGEDNQGCPKLILGGEHAVPEGITAAEAKGRRFISAPLEICRYLASAHGLGNPIKLGIVKEIDSTQWKPSHRHDSACPLPCRHLTGREECYERKRFLVWDGGKIGPEA